MLFNTLHLVFEKLPINKVIIVIILQDIVPLCTVSAGVSRTE